MSEKFSLDPEFVEKYSTRKPPFGFNGLGEMVYLRTYSRIKPDGVQEQWHETIERVVNGTYRMQQKHIESGNLGWEPEKAQESAQEMYDRIWNMKFLPPGRGLWAMGSPLTEELNLYAALNNCFSGDTQFITDKGLVSFNETAESTVKVLNSNGEFVPANVRSFGVQSLQKITLKPYKKRSNLTHTFKVTPDHTWILKDGSRTTSLKVGDVVRTQTVSIDKSSHLYTDGLRHGVIFGDGTQHTYCPDRFMIRLCDVKTQNLQSVLESHPRYVSTTNVGGDPFVTLRSDVNFKLLPNKEVLGKHYTPEYLAGFIDGWAAADSYTKKTGSRSIDTQKIEAAEWLIEHAPFAGYVVTGHGVDNAKTNFGERKTPLNRMSITEQEVFFSVVNIEDIGEAEVFCVTEPDTSSFTLAGGILTGNCAFVSTENLKKDLSEPFTFLMDASMLGIGVGFDTKGAGQIKIQNIECPVQFSETKDTHTILIDDTIDHVKFVVPDTREGWVESLKVLLESYFVKNRKPVLFDYSLVRPENLPIKGFGGVSSGPLPLLKMHERIRAILDKRSKSENPTISITDITDIMNLIGKCVVAGNVRRTAEIAFGDPNSEEFINLKNPVVNPERNDWDTGWGWTSNNSIFAELGMDYTRVAELVGINGEPGFAWLPNMRDYSRMNGKKDNKDKNAMGSNPCVEQTLESFELCCLVESLPNRHESLEDYLRTLKFAYLYAKTVTLGNTPWAKTNRVLLKNRRIGLSQSGIQQTISNIGIEKYRELCEKGYDTVQHYDKVYSDWFAIPRSIKTTSVKPSGSVSLLAGATPGMHWPENKTYIRRMRLSKNSNMIPSLLEAGYPIEDTFGDPSSCVVEIPVRIEENIRTVREVSIWEQLAMAAFLQKYWADNQVSSTVTFNPETEKDQIAPALNYYQYQLKGISFLPTYPAGAYKQMPYEACSDAEYEQRLAALKPLNFGQTTEKAVAERFCDGDSCIVL